MADKYVAPEYNLKAFHCPHCGVYAKQSFHNGKQFLGTDKSLHFGLSICSHCGEKSVWREVWEENQADSQSSAKSSVSKAELIFPDASIAPMPSEDMPQDIKDDYLEARTIVNRSPRGAAALLRLCVQKLMPHLGGGGKDINEDIKSLVGKGLPVEIQQALDALRVIGNESVHPGQMAVKDDKTSALQLFGLLNFIVEDRITRPKKIAEFYNTLPQDKRDAIAKRDGKK
jgi:hypothetical protein